MGSIEQEQIPDPSGSRSHVAESDSQRHESEATEVSVGKQKVHNSTASGSSQDGPPASPRSYNETDEWFAQSMLQHSQQTLWVCEHMLARGHGRGRVSKLVLHVRAEHRSRMSTLEECLRRWQKLLAENLDFDAQSRHLYATAFVAADDDEADQLFLTQLSADRAAEISMSRKEMKDGKDGKARELSDRILEDQGDIDKLLRSLLNKSIQKAGAGSVRRLNLLLVEAGLKPDLIDLWASSPERDWYMGRRIRSWSGVGIGLIFIAVALVLTAGTVTHSTWSPERFWGVASGVLGLIVLGWSTVPYWAARQAFKARKRADTRYRVDEALGSLRQAMEADQATRAQIARMFELNRRQLDEYQELTKSQQRLAFALTWGAAIASLVILIVGSTIALRIPVDQADDKFIAGGLTALGSLLSAFLGAVFFRGHEHAMKQLNRYYHEPSLTGRLLAAERLLEHLPANSDEKRAAASAIMTRILEILQWVPSDDETKKPKSEQAQQPE